MLLKGHANNSLATTQMLDYISYLMCIKKLYLHLTEQVKTVRFEDLIMHQVWTTQTIS